MSKKICFIYTNTNGLHQFNKDVNKKYIFSFARMVALHYSIGKYVDGKYIEEKRADTIITPDCITFDKKAVEIHGITQEYANKHGKDIFEVMKELKKDLNSVDVIVSHNLPFHLRAIQVECFRTFTKIEFTNFICIDTISYNHQFEFPKLQTLKQKLKVSETKDNLETIQKIFFKLYEK